MARPSPSLMDRRKLALIIDNRKYDRSENRLRSSFNNTTELGVLLEEIRFEVTRRPDVAVDIMDEVRQFKAQIQDGDLVLFYFFGHGCRVKNQYYLMPTDDRNIEADEDVKTYGTNVRRILDRLMEDKQPYVTILILDCCRRYFLKTPSASDSTIDGTVLIEEGAPDDAFIQLACSENGTVKDGLFTEYLLKYITKKNTDVRDVFQLISDDVYKKRHKKQRPLSMDGLPEPELIYLNPAKSSLPNIPENAIWKSHAHTVVAGRVVGNTTDGLHCPKGLWMGKNQSILVVDSMNHRIMKYNQGDINGQRIAGKNVPGYRSGLLNGPTNAIFDATSKSLIICDYNNRRVLRLFRRGKKYVKTNIQNVYCFGVAVDDEGSLYVSDTERHEVRRYRPGKKYGKVVAGGNGQGSRPNQLNHPTYICVDDDQSVYVSDAWNDRVVKWSKGKKEGDVVAGGQGKGRDRNQLDCPAGVLVDQVGTVYVADHRNFRVMRWRKGVKYGEVIAGGFYSANYPNQMRIPFFPGSRSDQLNGPEGLAFDQDGNLYVADSYNHRIQRFRIQGN